MKGDSIPTPAWLLPFIEGWFDPYPLDGDGPNEPPAGAKVWVNPGSSRKAGAIENAIRWHQAGHVVVCYLPIETSTQYAKRLLQYGVRRLYFERRPYEGCRGIEIVILTGEEKPGRSTTMIGEIPVYDRPMYRHRPGTFTLCYTGCGLVVPCETEAKFRSDDPHFKTREGAARWWERHHPKPDPSGGAKGGG